MGTRYFALAVGVVYLLVGVMGLLNLGETAYTGDPLAVSASQGNLLGIFPVNILHDIVHLAVGLGGILAYRSYNGARAFSRGLAIFYGLIGVMGLLPAPFNTTFGLIPIFGNDVWLHLLTAAAAAYFGFAAQPERATFVDASRRR